MRATKRILTAALILFFCVNFNTVIGQESDSGTLKSDSLYFESPALFSCNIQFPNDYDSEKALPLLITDMVHLIIHSRTSGIALKVHNLFWPHHKHLING